MRSLIIATAIILTITGLSIFNAISASRKADALLERIGDIETAEDVESFDSDWREVETILRVTVHEERLREVRTAIIELAAAVREGSDRSRHRETLYAAVKDAISREKPLPLQIF